MADFRAAGFRESHVSPAAHELYRSLVDAYLDTGRLPDPEGSVHLEELESEDWVALDSAGRVAVLYPFSLEPAGIEVRFGGAVRQAMCAIDALGIAPMLATDVEVCSACPISGVKLTVSVNATGKVIADPDGIVVVRRRSSGPAHLNRCSATRFFGSELDAITWCERNGQAGDVVLALDDAIAEASAIFGRCYSDGVRMVF
jgi:hypothetical protein